MDASRYIQLYNDLKTKRLPLEKMWCDCYKYSFPARGIAFGTEYAGNLESYQAGASKMQADLYDTTATDSCKIAAAAFVYGMTPASSLWFGLTVPDANQETKDFLDSLSTETHAGIHSSNYDAPSYESLLDTVIAGMSVLYIEEGTDTDFSFEQWALHSCYCSASKRGGIIDTIVRYYTLTAEQAINEYGENNVSRKLKETAEKKPYEAFEFIHVIRPRPVIVGKRRKVKEVLMPFESVRVELKNKKIVKEGGYHEFPCAVPRWLKMLESVYALGPMFEALPDAKTLNSMERLDLSQLDMAISGMWGAVDDGVLNPKTIRVGARKIVFMKNKESFFPLTPGGNANLAEAKTAQKRSAIRRVLMADQLEPMSAGPAKTATEVHYRINMIRQIMGPTFGRLQSEYQQPLVFRCAGIKLRQKLKNGVTLPEQLRDQPVRLTYISPMARAAKLEDVAAMDRFEEKLARTAQIDPRIVDLYKLEDSVRESADLIGVPKKLVRTADEVEAYRKELAAAQPPPTPAAPAVPAAAPNVPAAPGPAERMAGAPSPANMGGIRA